MALRGTSGFTLIELAITLVILGILTALGLPVFTDWINNTKIRTAAEGIANGVQLARAEAVRQNLKVQFVLDGTSGPSAWTVSSVSSTGVLTQVQQRTNEGSGNAIVGVLPSGATTVTYSGIGVITPNGDTTPSLTQIDVCSSAAMLSGNMRKMRITIGTGGNVKMCDPQAAATDPRGCPVVSPSQC